MKAQCAIAARLCAMGLLAGLGFLGGCTTGRHNTADTPGAGGSAPITLGANTLRYPLTTDPTTLDPALVQDGTTIDLLQQIYEGLVAWNEKNQIVPDLATSWDISKDGTVYTFHLRHGVKFHNGREVTAADFKYSLERVCAQGTHSETAPDYLKDIVGANDRMNGKPGVSEVSGVKVVDPYTLQITIDAFKPYWLGNMTYPTGYVVCKEAIEKNGGQITDEASAVGTGPFKLASFQHGYQVILQANPDYHGGRPRLDAISRPILKDASTRLNKYEADELDIVEVTPDDIDHINGDPKLKPDFHSFPHAAIWYVAMNQLAPDPSPFAKPEVRRAIAMAIDKQELLHVALQDQATIANGVLPPELPGYNPNVKPIPFDPAQAKALFAKAGYPGGAGFPALTFAFRQDMPEVGRAAQIIQHQLKTNLGIDLQLRPMDWTELLGVRKTLPFCLLHWGADYMDPQDFLSILLHTNRNEDHPENRLGYSNPAFDALCDRADVGHDPAGRLKMYQQAEQIAVDDAPWVPLYFEKTLNLIKPRVQHLRSSTFGFLPHTTTTVQ